MVMFSCNRCSKGLKKKDVLNHSYQCGGRHNINVTCIDCLKDFRGNDYDSHTSCVTEEVRYGGKGVVAKETGKKQNQWLGIVRQVLTVNQSLDHPVKKFLQSIQHFENIPRNKKKFHNWANSAMHINDTGFLDKVFEILQTEFQKSNEANKSKEDPKNSTDDVSDVQKDGTLVEGADQKGGEKKDKKHNCENEVESVEEVHKEENGVNDGCSIDKKKKKNKDDSTDREEEGFENGSNDHTLENGTEECDTPKKKKKHSDLVEEEPVEKGEPMELDEGGARETTEVSAQLSKKERKMKKKKAKFEAELQEIENFKKDGEEEDKVDQEEAPPTKKSKKRKRVDESKTDKPDKHDADEKSKKQKVDEERVNGNEVEESSGEPVAASPSKKQKFDWHQMIVDVLKKSKNDEVSVKKVTKKVITEYVSMYGDKGIHEKLNAKMTKKLKTCPGIRVLKDKVRLLETAD